MDDQEKNIRGMDSREENISLSQLFEEVYDHFDNAVQENDATNDPQSQKHIRETIKKLEELTRNVSAADMFSRNENFKEMDPHKLKFIMLPYMLGNLWQLITSEDRRQICEISQVYFNDFLTRCRDYEFIEDREITGWSENLNELPTVKKMTAEEKRNKKIQKLKQNKDLDARVKAFRESIASEKDPDESAIREIYVGLILKAINQVEDELESITSELELITFAEKREKDKGPRNTEPPPPPRQPLRPFIITKDVTQKKVFGLGYPSLPVMTVEELYQQRRATGEWGPPPASGGFTNPENTGEEAEEVAIESLVEVDDESNLERQRQNDEYKDDHRRGWGNRFNRS